MWLWGRSFLLEALLRGRGRAVGLRQRHDAVGAAQVRLQGLLVGGLQGLEQVLRLPAVVAVETPVAPEGRGGGGGDEKRETPAGRPAEDAPERGDSLPGDGPGLGVGVMDSLLDGLGQDGHVSGIVGEHG